MRNRKIIVVTIMILAVLMALVGCKSDGNVYNQVFYKAEEDKFVETGNRITINDDYTFIEEFNTDERERKFKGNYVDDDDLNLIYMELNSSSIEKFRREYRTQLKAMDYTASEIDNYIMPSVTGKSELYKYKDYYFKVNAINASREGDPATVNQLDGVYNTDSILGKKDSKIKLNLGSIYLKEIDEFGEEKYEKKIGEYLVEGDFITITPTVALSGGKVNPPMRYLLAEITLPTKYQTNVDDDNKYKENNVITVYPSVSIKVIVGSFYTNKSTK